MSRQTWHKHGVIFEPAARLGWARSPTGADTGLTTDGRLRIYFGSWDKQNRTSTAPEVNRNGRKRSPACWKRPCCRPEIWAALTTA
jgi:hypothetical protein